MFKQTSYEAKRLFLPLSPVLKQALAEGHVYARQVGVETTYVIADRCPNPVEVRRAIDARRRWKLAIVVCERLLTIAGFVVIASLATHIFW